MGWLQALKKSFFGENKPEELLDKGVAKTAKELLLGKDSKTSKVGGAASGGEVFHDNATHLKMFGGRDIDVIPSRNGAILQVSKVALASVWIRRSSPSLKPLTKLIKRCLSRTSLESMLRTNSRN